MNWLILINTLLLAAVVGSAYHQIRVWQPPAPKSPVLTDAVAAQQARAAFPPVDEAAITSQPLFWPSRRPPPPKVVTAPAPVVVNLLKDAELIGTFTSEQAKGAILRLTKKGPILRIQQGETVNGLTLLAANSVSAQFKDASGRLQTLMLTYAKQSNVPAPPVAERSQPIQPALTPAQPAVPAPPVELPWVPVTPPPKK